MDETEPFSSREIVVSKVVSSTIKKFRISFMTCKNKHKKDFRFACHRITEALRLATAQRGTFDFISVTTTVADYQSLPIFLKSNIVIAKVCKKRGEEKKIGFYQQSR